MENITSSLALEFYQLCSQAEKSDLDDILVKLCESAELNNAEPSLNQQENISNTHPLNNESDPNLSTNQVGQGGSKRSAADDGAQATKRACYRDDQLPSTSAAAHQQVPIPPPTHHRDEQPSTSAAAHQHHPSSAQQVPIPTPTHPSKIECSSCNILINKKYLSRHINSKAHKNRILLAHKTYENVTIIDTAFGNRLATYRISTPHSIGFEKPEVFMGRNKDTIESLINDNIKEHTVVKANFILQASFTQETKKRENQFDFQTFNNVFCMGDDFDIIFSGVQSEICTKLQQFEKKDSGWSLKRINYIEVNINKFNPLRGSSYIKLPHDIWTKRAVVNVQNKDNECFKWAVLSALYPVSNHAERTSSYKGHEHKLKFNGISLPMKLKDITKFESLNNISVNVFGLEFSEKVGKNQVIGPLYFTKSRKETHINLLYITLGDNAHYCYIKNLSRLVSSQINNKDHMKHICDGCLLFFPTIERLQEHNKDDCVHVITKLPNRSMRKDIFGNECPGNVLKFQNYHNQMQVPFVVYADFEAFLTPLTDDTHSAKTMKTHKHDVHSFSYYIKCSYDESLSRFRLYRGDDCGRKFMESLRTDVNELADHIITNVPMSDLTAQELQSYQNAINCHICSQPLNGDSVRDHDHLTGAFRGAAHSNCNLNYKIPSHVPIFLHNLSNYDAHFIVRELSSADGDIEIIPLNKEKYISFSEKMKVGGDKTIKLRFLDSLRFMSASLDSLSKNLGINDFIELKRQYPADEDFKLLIRKGVYPYEYIQSHTDLEAIKALPEAQHFYNQLSDSDVSKEDYEHAKSVWDHFDCKNMGDYSDLYLKTDVLLLTDIFENFRKLCIKTYGLDPAQYYTAPGLSWDAMLKLTRIELELLTDFDMVAFLKSGIRGGVSQCSNRYAKANNIYMNDYNSAKPESYLMYFDANNLYGWAMSQYLPTGNFEWVDSETDFNVSDTSDVGYILEVDLAYPDTLHDSHSDFPLCPQNICVGGSNDGKLVTTLQNKEKYIIHYRNLKQCIQLGMSLKKIHRILKFDQSPWLKKYIDLNTNMRTSAKTDFEKDFYKLMNNSVFGKTMENVEKRKTVKLLTHWENIGKRQGVGSLVACPNFHSLSIFAESLVAVQLNKTSILFNKPIYLGFCILDVSKTLMYNFHYNVMKDKYQDKIKLLYTDTDSLVYHIMTHDFYTDIRPYLTDYFDTSDYPPNNPFDYPCINKKKLGLFKDENSGRIFIEFVGLRAKMYAMDIEMHPTDKTNKSVRKAKGVNRAVTKKFTMANYKDVLEQKEVKSCEMIRFRSMKHILYTERINKISLSHNDTKRAQLANSFDTLAWGHYKLRGA